MTVLKDANFDFDDLAPIILPTPALPARVTKGDAGLTFVAGDFHFHPDSYSAECESIFLQAVRDANPGTIVLNGDLPDLLALSRYPRDARIKPALRRERELMHEFLWRLRAIAPKTKIVETNANHSGDGRESRWWRYLSENAGALFDLPEMRDVLSYQNIWHPKGADIDLVEHYQICPGFIAIHGDVVRGHAAYSARGMLEKWRINLIHGHTHRMGYFGYRVPAVADKKEHQMRAYEGGCMCRLDPPYLATSNWQQGFSIVRHDEEGDFNVEQVLIHQGKAIINSLGGSYRA